MAPEAASSLASFLLPMLEFDTSKRATAAKMLQHPWVDVQPAAKASPSRSSGTSPTYPKSLEDGVSASPSRHSGPVSPVTPDAASQKQLAGGSSPSRLAPLLATTRAATAPHLGDRRSTLAHTGMDAAAQGSGSSKRLQPLSESLRAAPAASSHSPIRLVGQVLGGMGLLGHSNRDAASAAAAATAARGNTSPARLAPIFTRSTTTG
jgi:hypothetical protein